MARGGGAAVDREPGRMARVKRRVVTRIQIVNWTEQGQCRNIDEGIIRHRGSLF
jgi:hypothetical protein